MNFDVSNLDNGTRLKILDYVLREKKVSYEDLGVSRVMVYNYRKGKYRVPDEVVSRAVQFLTPDELSRFIVGIDIEKVGYNEAMAVIIKALKNPEFREIFLALLQRNLGDYIRSTSYSYVVSKENLELFKKVISKRSKNTFEDYWRYINRLLKDLNYIISPDRTKEYLLEQGEESPHRARQMAVALKLFIKEVVRPKEPYLAQILYSSFSIPRPKTEYKPEPLSLELLKRIYNEIEELGAKTYFLLLVETGLRTGELFSLKINQIDLKHKVIKLLKQSETKRAYITFLHEKTAKWVEENYLPYREEYIKRHWGGVAAIGQDVEAWKQKFFPQNEDRIRSEIKEAMKKAGKEFRLYDVRAFFAAYLIKQGVSPMIVNILQGRAAPGQFKILQEHYLPFSEEELREIYEKYAPKLLD